MFSVSGLADSQNTKPGLESSWEFFMSGLARSMELDSFTGWIDILVEKETLVEFV